MSVRLKAPDGSFEHNSDPMLENEDVFGALKVAARLKASFDRMSE